jgi:hypothetical protein
MKEDHMKNPVMTSSLWPRSVVALSFLALFSGCPTGSLSNPKSAQMDLAPCSLTTGVFNTSGAAEIYSFIEALPRGKYMRANFEIYVDNPIKVSDTRTNRSQVQVLEKYSGAEDAETAEQFVRCRENSGDFVSYQTDVTIPTRLVRYKSGLFDIDYQQMHIDYASALTARHSSRFGGDERNQAPTTIADAVGRYWNSGVVWLRRSDNVFEFQGRRTEGTRRISGKATFLRKDLPNDL